MTRKGRRLYVGVLDTSTSMEYVMEETLAAWNGLVKDQAKLGEAFVSLFTFSTRVHRHYQFVEADEVPVLGIRAEGWTALRDGMGTAIENTGTLLALMPEHERPEEVFVVVYTDGEENHSHYFSTEKLRGMVEHQQGKYGWKFLFQGANQDAILAAREIGIPRRMSMTYDTHNTSQTFTNTSEMLSRGSQSGIYAYTEEERARATSK